MTVEKKLRFAVIGTGYWARYQIPAWLELDGVELVALCNRTKTKAEVLAHQYHIPRIYDNVERLLQEESLDFVDIISDVDTHASFTHMAAKKGIAVICQKPMAPRLTQAMDMVADCQLSKTPFFIHENWRWQSPIRKVKEILETNIIGKPFKARVSFCSGFPVFENQPFLAELEEFILTDIGSHILDVCRFLFGEVSSVLCHTASVNPKIKGEDVAMVMLKMKNGISCYAEMSYASIQEHESFPQTFIEVEGEHGSIQLGRNFEIKLNTRAGTVLYRVNLKEYSWADPAYLLVHSSIVDCNQNILNDLKGIAPAETTGLDNLKTVHLVHGCYASARSHQLITMDTST